MAATLWKIGLAHAEGSVYEGEYRGTWIRLIRLTDFNVWPGRNRTGEKDATTTRWDGYIASGIERIDLGKVTPGWSIVAECYSTRREALIRLTRYIDAQLVEGENSATHCR